MKMRRVSAWEKGEPFMFALCVCFVAGECDKYTKCRERSSNYIEKARGTVVVTK